jgi:hypothetical protein
MSNHNTLHAPSVVLAPLERHALLRALRVVRREARQRGDAIVVAGHGLAARHTWSLIRADGDPSGSLVQPSTGPIGLGLSVCSYAGELVLGVSVDRTLVADSEMLLQALTDEVEAVLLSGDEGAAS